MSDFEGVEYLPEQDAFVVRVALASGQTYEDFFADHESAALVRELVVLRHGLHAERNFPHLELREVCQRMLALLDQRNLVALPGSLDWLARIPMGQDEFLRLSR
jgi:hypothetical protein